MNLSQLILLPLSNTYGCITYIRNKLFDWRILPSASYDIPVISVGNLSAGGTGKTPHVEYLLRMLVKSHKVAVLSRGYKRKTRGFKLATEGSTFKDIGDEPLQYKKNFKEVLVAVDESRRSGIEIIMQHFPGIQAIILDDAFQHRYVRPGISILTTDFHRLYPNDFMIPSGSLREFRKGAGRADIILITKTPSVLSPITVRRITGLIKPRRHQQLFFTYFAYGDLVPMAGSGDNELIETCRHVLMFSGIANSYPLKEYLASKFTNVHTINFPDHHHYTVKDLNRIRRKFDRILSRHKIIVTTQKDVMRLDSGEMGALMSDLPVYYIPVEVKFHKEDNLIFDARIKDYVKNHQRGDRVPGKANH